MGERKTRGIQVTRVDAFDEYYDEERESMDNREYQSAECEAPHKDGSTCMPSWDGYGYVCTNRIIQERHDAEARQVITHQTKMAMKRQARRYGEQVRLLEDAGLEKDRARVRRAWTSFRAQLGRGYLREVAVIAYQKAYSR
jgi:hypothetical protein